MVEDLGVITPPVHRLREELGYPGMRVLQFGFGGGRSNHNAPENYPERCVVYTGTHDHDPLAGWWEHATETERERAAAAWREAGIDEPEPAWSLLRLAYSTRADLAIVQMQDVLGLGREARFNTPGTVEGNWSWCLEPGRLTDALAERLLEATVSFGR